MKYRKMKALKNTRIEIGMISGLSSAIYPLSEMLLKQHPSVINSSPINVLILLFPLNMLNTPSETKNEPMRIM